MKISQLINRLKNAWKNYGDWPVSIDEGCISDVVLRHCEDGCINTPPSGGENEIFIEFRTK